MDGTAHFASEKPPMFYYTVRPQNDHHPLPEHRLLRFCDQRLQNLDEFDLLGHRLLGTAGQIYLQAYTGWQLAYM